MCAIVQTVAAPSHTLPLHHPYQEHIMRVDIYRRQEPQQHFSYLAVPEGKVIPEEATSTDWQPEAQSVEMDEDKDALPQYHIAQPVEQITAKGYAITGLKDIDAD
jgi:hypothetical protein